MKILYAVNVSGNGQISRALELILVLKNFGEVDIVASGAITKGELPWLIKYNFSGLELVYDKNGTINILKCLKYNDFNTFFKNVKFLPVSDYDIVINDFEPITAWACRLRNVSCIGFSHQSAVLGRQVPRPLSSNILGQLLMKWYAPVTYRYGLHFSPFNSTTFTPVIRKDIRLSTPTMGNHHTVYLPQYADNDIISFLDQFKEQKFEVFSKTCEIPTVHKNISIEPVDRQRFASSITSSKGVLCHAGFETPAEAMFLQKKLCVIPVKENFEQQCNAHVLKRMRVTVIQYLSEKGGVDFANWIKFGKPICVDYRDITSEIVDYVLVRHTSHIDTLPNFAISSGMSL